MGWFKKHSDSIATISVIFGVFIWLWTQFSNINNKFTSLEKDIAIIKTVLIMKNILPSELCKEKDK
jgi:hypothetical protein